MEATMREMLLLAGKGDTGAKEELVRRNLGLVGSIVKRYEHRGHDREELFQIGSLGLLKAIEKFDVTYEVEFSTYAVPMISGEIRRFLRDDGPIRVSRSLKEQGWRIQQAKERINDEKGREATLQELTEATGLGREEIVLALEANSQVESIYRSIHQADGSEVYLVDQVTSGEGIGKTCAAMDGDREQERMLNRMVVEQLLESLPQQERTLLQLRYFKEQTQVQVAKALGMSQVSVSRMEKRILLKLRAKLMQ